MEEKNVMPNVIVDAPEGVIVEVRFGDEPAVEAAPAEEKVEEPVVEEAPAEEAASEEAPAEEPAPEEKKEERVYASEEEVINRIAELEAEKARLVEENACLDQEIEDLYQAKLKELFAEYRETIDAHASIAESYNAIVAEFREAAEKFNKVYAEANFDLAALKSKKEAR